MQVGRKVILNVVHTPLEEIFDELDFDGSFSLSNRKSKTAQISRRILFNWKNLGRNH